MNNINVLLDKQLFEEKHVFRLPPFYRFLIRPYYNLHFNFYQIYLKSREEIIKVEERLDMSEIDWLNIMEQQ